MTIALLGDSMTDCWGPDCPELREELCRRWPRTRFVLENHGLGGTRAGYGLWRVGHDYEKNGAIRACLSYSGPDVVIVESFAYNNRADGPEWLGEYADLLRRLVAEIRRTTAAHVLFHLTIPPDRDHFIEDVPNFRYTSPARRRQMADEVTLYLQEARRVAREAGWPLADVCAEVQARVAAGEEPARFINQADMIHPSRHGYAVTAQVLARALAENGMVEEEQA